MRKLEHYVIHYVTLVALATALLQGCPEPSCMSQIWRRVTERPPATKKRSTSLYNGANGCSDDCAALASSNGISYTQFRAYNPSINQDCTNLLSGTRICVGLPGPTYNGTTIDGATITKTDQYASSTVAPPSNVATGTTRKCGKYYNVQPGEICEKVAMNNSIGMCWIRDNGDISANVSSTSNHTL